MLYFGFGTLICVFGAIALALGSRFVKNVDTKVNMTLCSVFLGMIWAICYGVCMCVYSEHTVDNYYSDSIVSDTLYIKSGSSSSSITGSFVIGTGSITQKNMFHFYIIRKDSSLQFVNFDANVTKIKELPVDTSKRFNPYVVTLKYTRGVIYYDFFMRFIFGAPYQRDVHCNQLIENVICVPEGTVKTSLDLETLH